jgi:multiple sugar transport system ATP-binding protein
MELRAEIKSLHQRFNTTMIYVTHDQVEAMTLADQIVVMRDGVIVQQGRRWRFTIAPATPSWRALSAPRR